MTHNSDIVAGKTDYKSSDDLRVRVGKLETVSEGVTARLSSIEQTLKRVEDRLAKPVNFQMLSFGTVVLGLILVPLIYFGKENRNALLLLADGHVKMLERVVILERDAHWTNYVREQYVNPEMIEMNDQLRGAEGASQRRNAELQARMQAFETKVDELIGKMECQEVPNAK